MYDGATQQSMTIYATEHENPMFIMGLSLGSMEEHTEFNWHKALNYVPSSWPSE